MSKQADYIAECLVKAYLDGGVNLPTAYENRAFSKPGPDEPWAALFLLPDKPRPVTLGPHGVTSNASGYDKNTAFFDCIYLQDGTAGINAKYNELASWFTAGRRFIHNGTGVSVRSCGRGRGREDDGWWTVPVSINWYSKLHRGV